MRTYFQVCPSQHSRFFVYQRCFNKSRYLHNFSVFQNVLVFNIVFSTNIQHNQITTASTGKIII